MGDNIKEYKVYRSITDILANNHSYSERWGDFELGLVTAWESGRKHKKDYFNHLISYMENGALPKLSFKGGHIMPFEKVYKHEAQYIYKYGTLNYLAQRQGILGIDLDIDTIRDEHMILTCSLTGLQTVFTSDINLYKENKTFNKRFENASDI